MQLLIAYLDRAQTIVRTENYTAPKGRYTELELEAIGRERYVSLNESGVHKVCIEWETVTTIQVYVLSAKLHLDR